jgi:hypothetical protein
MSNPDRYNTFTAIDLVPVTPSDTVDLPLAARALRIGTGGTLRFTASNGNVRNTVVESGELFLIGAIRVHATGTTATGIEALI